MAKKQENPNFKKSYTKMTPEELALWLHANRKAHAFSSKKDFKRNPKHRGKEDFWVLFFLVGAFPGVRRRFRA